MRAVINLSTSKYKAGQQRLKESILGKTTADIYWYRSEMQVGAPSHQTSPYTFKPFALERARNNGYRQVLWLDASMYILKSIEPIFDQISKDGYFFQDSGWMNPRWTTPEQAKYFGTMVGKMISSGVLGLDFRTKEGNLFLDKWLQAAKDGMFNGSHDDTRHDQTAASLIIEQMGLKITPNHTHWTYGTPEEEYPDNIVLIANGIC